MINFIFFHTLSSHCSRVWEKAETEEKFQTKKNSCTLIIMYIGLSFR